MRFSFFCGSHREPLRVKVYDLTDIYRRKYSITHTRVIPNTHKQTYYTHDTWCRHTHTHHGDMTVSHTHKFRKAAKDKREREVRAGSPLVLVSFHKHPDSSTDSKTDKPLTRMRHWSRTMLHTLGTVKGGEKNKM